MLAGSLEGRVDIVFCPNRRPSDRYGGPAGARAWGCGCPGEALLRRYWSGPHAR